MTKNPKRSSPGMSSKASKALQSNKTSALTRSLAGSVLSQTAKGKKK